MRTITSTWYYSVGRCKVFRGILFRVGVPRVSDELALGRWVCSRRKLAIAALRCRRVASGKTMYLLSGTSSNHRFSRIFMKPRFLLRTLTIALCATLLLIVNRPTTRYPSHRYRAPEFELLDLNGNQVRLSTFRGKAVVLNFWASWCAPCRREIPWFIEFQKEYGPRGLRIIGVSMDEGGENAIAPFIRRTGIDYVVLLGDSHIASLYGGLDILPTTYYIAPDGNVRAFVKGVVSKTEVEHDIKKVLEERDQN